MSKLTRVTDAYLWVVSNFKGAITRLLEDKLSDTLNIKDFGAKCDGVTDDTGIINGIIQRANGGMIKIDFPYGSVVKIAGTILVPQGVSINLNHSILSGNGDTTTAGTNVMFESAYWDNGVLKSNWSTTVDVSGIVPDARIYDGRIRFAGTAFKVYQWIYGSSIKNIRVTATTDPVIIKDSFYGTFEEISVMSPPVANTGMGFQIESNIQAMGIRKCVAAGFGTGWKITGGSATECFDTCTAEHNSRGIDIYGSGGSSIQNLKLHNWYFEKNLIAIRVDPTATVERLYIDNCYLHWSQIHVDGTTIISGLLSKSCSIKDGTDSSGTAWRGDFSVAGRSGEKTLVIELEDVASSSQSGSTLPSNIKVRNAEVTRTEALLNSEGLVLARNYRHTSTTPKHFTGQTLPTILPKDTVPFCTVTRTATRVEVLTQILQNQHNIVDFNFHMVDAGVTKQSAGILFGSFSLIQTKDSVVPTIAYEGGRLKFSFSGTAITDFKGVCLIK